MVSYEVTKVTNRDDFISKIDMLPRAYVTHYPWGCEYRPETFGCLAWDDEHIHVYMRSYDKYIRAEVTCDNGDIFEDSCMEFFFNPMPGIYEGFFNVEVNSLGYLYLACGPEILEKRTLLKSDKYNHFGVEIRKEPKIHGSGYWDFCASIPFKYIEEHLPDFKPHNNMHFTGNFFKCGDKTSYPHYGCWSEIIPDSEIPQFYRIKYFGGIDFVNK